MNRIDLHVHTSCSDSSLDVQRVMELVTQQGLTTCSITDHDTFLAYEQLEKMRVPCRLLKGIELSAYDEVSNHPVHILGYGFSKETPHVDVLCQLTNQRLKEKSLWQIKQLQQHGYPITVEEVLEKAKDSASIYKQHILSVLMDHGVCTSIYGSFYQTVFKQDGFCVKSMEYPSIQEVIQAIHADQGIAILAHPYLSHMEDQLKRIYQMGINGIEVYHSSHRDDMVKALHAFAKEYALLETGGSDYHGDYGLEPMIGEVHAAWQNEEACVCRMNVWK